MTETPFSTVLASRRAVLSAGGATLVGLAGCLKLTGEADVNGPKNGDDLPQDRTPDDGYPPEFEQMPEERSIDVDSFETADVEGTAVPLAPIEDAYYWYARGEARFVDARGSSSYEQSHVYGAVLSPAPDGGERKSDPVEQWPKGDRIVCYCSCPHHLSSLRASDLLSKGYETVLVVDEGFREWHDRNYPLAGSQVESLPPIRVIEGRTGAAFAGQSAWARHPPSGQREATPIAADGTYRLELPFSDVTDSSVIAVNTPAYRVEAALGELTADVVTSSDADGIGAERPRVRARER